MMYCCRMSRSSATGTRSAKTFASTGVSRLIARETVGWDTLNASAISAWTRLRRA